jgi:hypothetical protein
MNCDGCTACCLILPIPSIGKAAGEWCKDCDRGVGCKAWGKRPDACKGFRCAYFQMPKVSPDLRPDHCHVIFERLGGAMVGTLHPDYPDAHMRQPVLGQIQHFLREGLSVIVSSFKHRRSQVFPVAGKTGEQVWVEFDQQRKALWQ